MEGDGAGPSAPDVSRALVDEGVLTEAQREWALQIYGKTGSPLETILVATGLVGREALYRALARLWDRPYIDVSSYTIDPSLLPDVEPDRLVREAWLPIRRLATGHVLVAGSQAPTEAHISAIKAAMRQPIEYAVASDADIRAELRQTLRHVVHDRAAFGLWRRGEDQSARQVMLGGQWLAVAAVALLLWAAVAVAPVLAIRVITLVTACSFVTGVVFKFAVCLKGASLDRRRRTAKGELPETDLPVYTVLVPLYREANMAASLMESLSSLDYPPDKLEILLLLEEDDAETIAAVRAAAPPQNMLVTTIPDGVPKTKPKACNVGLFAATGEYLVVYDAEDRPEPDQLKKAVAAFRHGGDRLLCVQAALNYWNVDENALTRMFTVEYSFWYDYMLPGLDALRLPIPLGGSSNHIRTDILRMLGGWDPFNVTEDADLGIRAAALGFTVGVLDSTTYEEANRSAGNWIRQRSRWLKGYMQTVLVYTRHPVARARITGTRGALAFLLLIGGTAVTCLAIPPLYLVCTASFFTRNGALGAAFPAWAMAFAWGSVIIGNALMVYMSMMGAFARRRYGLVFWALLTPWYLPLHGLAAYWAAWQLAARPHYWEKTLHGISGLTPHAGSAAFRSGGAG